MTSQFPAKKRIILLRCSLAFCLPLTLGCQSVLGKNLVSSEIEGVDYAIQGEYVGSNSHGDSLGIQVIAQGSGKFRCLVFQNGLPGMGWDGKARLEGSGQVSATKVDFMLVQGGTFSVDTAGKTLSGIDSLQATFSAQKLFRESPTALQTPPTGSVVLFDGADVKAWEGAVYTADQFLSPQGGTSTSGAVTKQAFKDFQMHLEFRIPFLPSATGQSRGNSGIYLQNRYELQILDSFGIWPVDTVEGARQCGAFWEQNRPKMNMCFPPNRWQTYDIEFRAARFSEDQKTILEKAFVTVKHNGMVIQDHWVFPGHTLLGNIEGPEPGPHRLQWHGEEVVYRNIWVLEKSPETMGVFPTQSGGNFRKNGLVKRIYQVNSAFSGTFYNVRGQNRGPQLNSKPGM